MSIWPNQIKAIDPHQKFIATNTDNLPTSLTDQGGVRNESVFDNEGRLIQSIDASGHETLYHYDEAKENHVSSHLPFKIDYPTFSRRIEYDLLERVTRKIDDLRNGTTREMHFTYDRAGRVISSIDAEGRLTRYEYDELNRPVLIIDSQNNEIRQKFDNRGNLIEVQDPNHGITYYEYDKNNRPTRIIRPLGQQTSFEYDAVGNRTAVVDAKGQRIEYTYNEINKLTRVRYYAAGDHSQPVKTVDFTYNALGSLLAYNDGTTSAAYAYDDLQRKTHESVDYGPFSR